MARLVTVETYFDLALPSVAKSLLEQHGFCVSLFDENLAALGLALDELKIMVPDSELEAARQLLAGL